jgi:Phosphotransferase enzyme family
MAMISMTNNIFHRGIGTVRKIGDATRIRAEYAWYSSVPGLVAMHSPRVAELTQISDKSAGYLMRVVPNKTLSEMALQECPDSYNWNRIANATLRYLTLLQSHRVGVRHPGRDDLLLEKSIRRIQQIENPVRYQRAMELVDFLTGKDNGPWCITHGDLCFSNMFWDAEEEFITVIDPRGRDSNDNHVMHGSHAYDLFKLYHSIVGLYEFVVNDREGPGAWVTGREDFRKIILNYAQGCGYSEEVMLAGATLLFYTMSPLHSAERRERILKRADTLFGVWKVGFTPYEEPKNENLHDGGG